MISQVMNMLVAQASRSLRELVTTVAVAVVVLLLMCVSLGFGTYAAFQYLSIIAGSAGAAFIISAAYLALFMAAAGFWLWPTRARRPGRVNMPSVPAQAAISDPTIKSLIADANLQQQRFFYALLEAGRKVSPLQIATLALIAGFVLVRKSKKGSARDKIE